MPSRDHELAIDLLRRSPRTLARILRHAFGIEVGEELESVRRVGRGLGATSHLPWTESRAANVAALDADTLERLVVRVIGERRWPDGA